MSTQNPINPSTDHQQYGTIIIIMYSNGYSSFEFDITSPVLWSLISTVLALMAVCLILVSVYEDFITSLLNLVWSWLDCTILLFTVSAIFYDHIFYILFIPHWIIIMLPYLWWPVTAALMLIANDCETSRIIRVSILFLLISLLVIPTSVGSLTLPVLCISSQWMNCNIFPYCNTMQIVDRILDIN